MKSNLMTPILKCSRLRWPFQRHSAAWLLTLATNLPAVAQVGNLLYRRLEVGWAQKWRPVADCQSATQQTASLRYGARSPRSKVAATFTLCLLGCLLTAHGQDPWLTNTNYPMDTSVSKGATVSFRLFATSTNVPVTYQWQHEGSNLLGATNVTLLITNVTVAHAGGYTAWITNAIGGFTNSRTASLTVDPTFTKIMTGVIVTDAEGSEAGNWADYDNDGYVDLFVANSAPSDSTRNTLYHNIGGTNFQNNAATNFVRVAASPVTTDGMRVWMAAWADYNNDGNVDLIAANLDPGSLAQRLYRNNGNGRFTAVVDAALRSDTTAAACPWWIDYDNDGFLDLFMAKGVYFSPAANDCLFRNNGDGTFKKMTTSEIGPMLNDQAQNHVCNSVDYDNDGRQELTVWDGQVYTNVFWHWQADGTFVKTRPSGIPITGGAAQSWGDYNNDGWLDMFGNVANGAPILLRNLGAGGFTNVTTTLNLTAPLGIVNCPAWGDYDNDGWLDLFYTAWGSPVDTPSKLFHNNRDGTFTQILSGSPVWDGGRLVAPSWIDYDNDGFLDLFIAVGDAVAERNLLYRNNGNTNHWLKVKLDGRASNRSGIHARVKLEATINGQTFLQMREISCENAFAGQNGLLAHFGLGDATNVTTLRIEWPSGIVQELQNVPANQFLTVVESQGYSPTNPRPAFTGATKDASGAQLSFAEPAAGARYILEASSDLVSWTKLMARTSIGVTTNYTDTRATNYPSRFYRLQVP